MRLRRQGLKRERRQRKKSWDQGPAYLKETKPLCDSHQRQEAGRPWLRCPPEIFPASKPCQPLVMASHHAPHGFRFLVFLSTSCTRSHRRSRCPPATILQDRETPIGMRRRAEARVQARRTPPRFVSSQSKHLEPKR